MAKKTTKKTTKPKKEAKPKKTVAKKTNSKKSDSVKAAKKITPKKSAAKKTVSKKTAPKKTAVKKSQTKKAVSSGRIKKAYTKKELAEFKEIILERREEIITQLQNLKEQMMDPTTGQYVNESSPYSLHMAEQGTDAQEREKLYLWAQRENKFLGYLEDALQRIEAGTYGICIECIDEPQHLCPTCPLIPKERLKAVPHTQHCVQIKQQMQKR
ncbi:MAG: conjugal transfer protein TraR [Melioribacteraceae bacterium]|nr:conjugal transfer protein TraR [Melioribacteraceae bacterium]MDD3557451.1 conjugal transfer protein TraR [Melioribacteraceae bacterium]